MTFFCSGNIWFIQNKIKFHHHPPLSTLFQTHRKIAHQQHTMSSPLFVDFTTLNVKEVEFCGASLNKEGYSVNISVGFKDKGEEKKKNVNAYFPKMKITHLAVDKTGKPQPHEPYCHIAFHEIDDPNPNGQKQKKTFENGQALHEHLIDLIWDNRDDILKYVKNKGQLAELKTKFTSKETLASNVPQFFNNGKCNDQGVPYAPSLKVKFPFAYLENGGGKDYNRILTRKDHEILSDCTQGTIRTPIPCTPLQLPDYLSYNTIIKPLLSIGFISYAFKEKKFNIVWQVKEILLCEKPQKYEAPEIPLEDYEQTQLQSDELMFS